VTVTGLSDAVSLASDRYGYCALLGTGNAKCWGYNANGELGAGTTATNSLVPVAVADLSGATSITGAGNGFGVYCALVSGGAAKCWGNNGQGTLGDGSNETSSNTPVNVSGLSNATALVSAGASVCALLRSGGVQCWGSNSFGELGNNGTELENATPVTVTSLSGATSLVTDGSGYCAVVLGGARCWGYNLFGQLGNGNKELSSPSPSNVEGLTS
jgi:alpha-tubulin suppressor-like RCC1 family protein